MSEVAPKVVIATHNEHKVREIRDILLPLVPGLRGEEIVSAAHFTAEAPVEDGVTFAENSLIKARALAEQTGLIALADDSGLCVDVLGGAPGIFSARWAGSHGDDVANLNLLLDQLGDVRAEHRGANFTCAATLVTPDGEEQVSYGYLRGRLADSPRGTGGFGYDPILIPDGETRTCGELTPGEKNDISHRGEAFRGLAAHLQKLI